MHVDLTQEEVAALREVLSNSLKGLPSEIRHTDSRIFRHELRSRRDILQRIWDRLQETDAA